MTATALEFFEVILKPCTRTYGVAPCAAAIGSTGSYKCYNSPATCQDAAHFSAGEQLVRWASASGDLPMDADAIPSLKGLQVRPQKLNPGESLGIRESVTASFGDHPHNDVGFDKYLASRDFNAYTKGTFWRKFYARWPNLKGLECRTVRGFSNQNIEDMERRYYIVDSTNGPDNSGNFSITAKDVLTFLDGDKAQAPKLSPGLLVADLTDVGTTLTLTPPGIGNLSYPASGLASIGDEVVTFTRSADVVTLTGRGLRGSKQDAHDLGSTFQISLNYTAEEPSYIFNDLISNFTDTPADYLDYAAWSAETSANIGRLYSGSVMKPTAVKKLAEELIAQVGLIVHTDTRAKKIALQALRNVAPLTQWDDNVFLKGSITGSIDQESRVTEVLFYYGQKNPLKKIDEDENYQAILNTVYSNAQDALEGAPAAIQKIYSRWITVGNRPAAIAISQLMVGRYGRAPKNISFSLPKTIEPLPAKTVSISSRVFEDSQGDVAPAVPYLITRVESRLTEYVVQAEQINVPLIAPGGPRIVYVDTSAFNINLKDLHDAIYLPATSGDEVVFIFSEGVTIGSTSTGAFAATNGGWPSGVDVSLDFRGGVIEGAGGQGGFAWLATMHGGNGPAFSGGKAFYTASPVTLINPKIWGGGGGGSYGTAPLGGRSYGGGGAGYAPGMGGSEGYQGVAGLGNGTKTAGGHGGKVNGDGGGVGGGDGGGPGLPGVSVGFAVGGAAGTAIDGISQCTITGTNDIRGPQIN